MNLENDDDNESEDDSLNPSTPSPTNQTEDGGDEFSGRSTSEPLKKRTTSKRKQAEEEYHLIKNLSQSIANKHKRKRNNTIFEAFGNYVAQALSELDKVASHLAQNKINNIFQAQAGLLTQEMQTQAMMQPQSQINYFHPIMQPGMSRSPQPPIYVQNSVPCSDDYC